MNTINKIISTLKSTLHITVSINNDELIYMKPIPLAVKSNYKIYPIKLEDINVVVLSCKEEIKSIKKHLSLFNEALELPIILDVNNLNSITKKYLIENGIAFITADSIYLPQLLIYLNNFNVKYKINSNKKLSKLAQTILISSLINKNNVDEDYTMDIESQSHLWNVTTMSSSRALKELVDFNYLSFQTIRRKKYYFLKDDFNIEKLISELKNPVIDILYIKSEDLKYFTKKSESSYSALSKYSNITNSKPTYAIQKDDFNEILKKNTNINIYDAEYDNNLIQFELWRYNINIANEDIVDIISLYLSLKSDLNIDDSRLHDAMNELYNQIKGMIH